MGPAVDSSIYVLAVCFGSTALIFVITATLNYLRAPASSASCHAHFLLATRIGNLVAVIALLASAFIDDSGYAVAANTIYGLLVINNAAFFLWHFFALTDVSMHIHLLVEIHRAGRISREGLQARYNKDVIIRARIPRLIALHQLSLEGGVLRVAGNTVVTNAKVFALCRAILGIPKRPILT